MLKMKIAVFMLQIIYPLVASGKNKTYELQQASLKVYLRCLVLMEMLMKKHLFTVIFICFGKSLNVISYCRTWESLQYAANVM